MAHEVKAIAGGFFRNATAANATVTAGTTLGHISAFNTLIPVKTRWAGQVTWMRGDGQTVEKEVLYRIEPPQAAPVIVAETMKRNDERRAMNDEGRGRNPEG